MLIDTHAHLSYPEFDDYGHGRELTEVVSRASAAGVNRIISVATDVESCRQTLRIAAKFESVYASLGLHPDMIPFVSLSDMKELATLASEPKVVAIGETGLDYYRTREHAPAQKDLLWAQLELARQRNLPVVIHNRSAEADLMEILRTQADRPHPWGVMHCFSGDEKFAFDCIGIGLLISFTGILTFKNAGTLRDVARKVSLDHVMLETDAPYLAPVPHRGKRNEPSFVPHIAETLAQIKGVSVDEVARATTANAERLFRFS